MAKSKKEVKEVKEVKKPILNSTADHDVKEEQIVKGNVVIHVKGVGKDRIYVFRKPIE